MKEKENMVRRFESSINNICVIRQAELKLKKVRLNLKLKRKD